jgi:hypothetical protein
MPCRGASPFVSREHERGEERALVLRDAGFGFGFDFAFDFDFAFAFAFDFAFDFDFAFAFAFDFAIAIDIAFAIAIDIAIAFAFAFAFDLAIDFAAASLTPLRTTDVWGRSGLRDDGLVLGGVQRGLRPSVLAVLPRLAAAAARGCALLRADGAARHAGRRLRASRGGACARNGRQAVVVERRAAAQERRSRCSGFTTM